VRSNKNSVTLLGERLRSIRKASGLSQEQIQYLTGIVQSQLARFESGKQSARIDDISMLAELYGMEDYELLQYKYAVPDSDFLKRNITKYLKSRRIDPAPFLREGAANNIETKLLQSKFFTSPRFAKEISEYLKEKHNVKFTTTRLSRALDSFVRRGLVEKLESDKKGKLQYRAKG
jgi:transcriptional regulator with XRE-family HTH domain